uniref:Uncharacterized protein n=1 Tax=Oryza glumipatula TaxID=40148 RepID=A0A0D9Y4S2_9ORYZ
MASFGETVRMAQAEQANATRKSIFMDVRFFSRRQQQQQQEGIARYVNLNTFYCDSSSIRESLDT